LKCTAASVIDPILLLLGLPHLPSLEEPSSGADL
jgi:hypothetical protein